jgi:glucan phosphoethanolaminetransferase (alkaline phosphatase superfamily)
MGLQTTTLPVELVYPTWSLMVLASIIVLLSFVIIFSYKKRVLQMRMCVYNAILILFFCILFGIYLWIFSQRPDFPNMKILFRPWASFPFIALIFTWLAIRNIGADETMVRSLERLR